MVISKASSGKSPEQVCLHTTTPICGLSDLAEARRKRGAGGSCHESKGGVDCAVGHV